ncbi:MAG: hypothetical protein AABY81_04560 [Pseudomonadota bacterium]
MSKSLGEELSESLSNLTALIIKSDNKDEWMELARQQVEIVNQLQVFIDEMVDAALPEYQVVTDELNAANAEAVAAKEDLSKIAATITKFADAIGKLTALAAKVAAA